MDLDQMAYRCPKAEVVETVRLEGYRLTFAAAGSGLATIFPEEGSHVDGVLWSLTGDCEKSLDLYEGYPDFYDKQEITVKNKGGREIKAIVYIMTKDYMQNFNPPGRSYLTGILKGCRQNQIPTEPILKAARKKDFWIKQLKMWMIQNGRALTKHKVTNIQTESVEKAALIRYFESLLEFTLDRSETNELAKDIWHLERLPLILRTNPIVNHKTLNFRGIRQPDIREEVKKAIYHHLKTEALGSIKRELSAMNKFSKYLDEKHSKISTCEEIDREIIEQFLINIKVESNGGNGIRDDLLKLRNVLETIGKIYDFPHLTKLFLKSDFPPERKAEFKSYSDSELKRLNAQIVKMEEQIARAMIIHQMLGTRISESTLTLRKDCLYKKELNLIKQILSYIIMQSRSARIQQICFAL